MENDKTVLTLDAGGTNFVFSAIQNNKKIIDDIKMSANGNDLDKCMSSIMLNQVTVQLRYFIKMIKPRDLVPLKDLSYTTLVLLVLLRQYILNIIYSSSYQKLINYNLIPLASPLNQG